MDMGFPNLPQKLHTLGALATPTLPVYSIEKYVRFDGSHGRSCILHKKDDSSQVVSFECLKVDFAVKKAVA